MATAEPNWFRTNQGGNGIAIGERAGSNPDS